MNFMQILNSLDELLYEVMSWVIFYPLTFWRAVRHPWGMMDYAESELAGAPEQQYLEALSPPLFLLLTLLLSHGIELALIGESPIVQSTRGLSGMIGSDSNLIELRMGAFAIFPLMLALRLVRRQKVRVDRNTLKMPFYSQCYATAPMALMFGLAATFLQCQPAALKVIGLALLPAGIAWFMLVETGWFCRRLGVSIRRALWNTLVAYGQALALMIVAMSFFT